MIRNLAKQEVKMGSVSFLVFQRIRRVVLRGGVLPVLLILLTPQTALSVPEYLGSEQGVLVLVTRLDEESSNQPSLTSAIVRWLESAYCYHAAVEVRFLDVSVPPGERPDITFLESLPIGSFAIIYGHCSVEEESILCYLDYDIVVNNGSEGYADPLVRDGIEFSLELSELAQTKVPDIVFFIGHSALVSVYYQRGEISIACQTCAIAQGRTEGVPDEYISEISSLWTEILNGTDNFNTITDLDDTIELEPEDGELYLSRALINARLGNYAAMLLDADTAIEFEPDNTESAIVYVAGILELHGIVRRAYNNGADITTEIFGRMEEYLDEALLIANRAIEHDSESADLFYNRAGVYGYRTEWPSAVEDLTAAIELNPDFAEAYNSRGNINVEMSFLEQGISDLSRAIELSPDSISYYENRAWAYRCAGEPENAQGDLQKVEELRGH